MNLLVLLSCILVAGVGYAHGDHCGMIFWNKIAAKYNLAVTADLAPQQESMAEDFFWDYFRSRKNLGKPIPAIATPSSAALGIFTKKISDTEEGGYHEVLTSFSGANPTEKRFATYVYSDATGQWDINGKLTNGIDEFIRTKKIELKAANLKGVRIDYEVINIGPADKPEEYLYVQIYEVA